jgi:biotin carboxyl carrier protein
MKIKVTVEDKSFEVEVGSLKAEPVIAVVDGERFEVWPEHGLEAKGWRVEGSASANGAANPQPANPQSANLPASNGQAMLAPIPGVIVSLAVQPGQAVTAGQELCVLEAMKMKNVIRAPRAGVIAAVRVTVGQTVKHKDVLVEY